MLLIIVCFFFNIFILIFFLLNLIKIVINKIVQPMGLTWPMWIGLDLYDGLGWPNSTHAHPYLQPIEGLSLYCYFYLSKCFYTLDILIQIVLSLLFNYYTQCQLEDMESKQGNMIVKLDMSNVMIGLNEIFVFQSLPTYIMSCFMVPFGLCKDLQHIMCSY